MLAGIGVLKRKELEANKIAKQGTQLTQPPINNEPMGTNNLTAQGQLDAVDCSDWVWSAQVMSAPAKSFHSRAPVVV